MSANPGDLETSEAFQLAKQLPHGKDRETTVIPASVSFVASRNEESFYHDNIPTHHGPSLSHAPRYQDVSCGAFLGGRPGHGR